MKGFVIEIAGNTTCAALEKGSVGIIITNKEGHSPIIVNGMDEQTLSYTWLKSELHIGDEITITFGDIDELKVSKPISVRDFHDVEAERQLMLDAYRELKQELLKEGLLKE
jgi:hypothetical protein